jgi:hypothetical protein
MERAFSGLDKADRDALASLLRKTLSRGGESHSFQKEANCKQRRKELRKKVLGVYGAAGSHWVGDGFPVGTVFPSRRVSELRPFLMLDYAGPAHFKPSDRPRGVEEHPHRGFETVTISYTPLHLSQS